MTARRKTTPRKQPVQDRAVFTVEAILEAATYILVRDGWDKFTTNRVAERAGVNIASLYQYFPNKESIVVELQRRHIDKARREFPRAMPALRSQQDLRALLKMMIDAAVAEHRVAPALHRVFAEELPRSARRREVSRRDEDITAEWTHLIGRFVKNVPNVDLAMFLCRVVTHAAIHEAAAERPDLLDDPLFADEVVTLLERFLRRSA
jgi:AcrR family transcriptional regulator